MSNFELLHFANPEELAQVAARQFLEILQARSTSILHHSITPFRPFSVALSGGRIARQLFSAVAEQAKAKSIQWTGVHFFWGDERCVPPSDPESNFAIARDLLLQPLAIPDPQIHRIRGEQDPELAAAQAATELFRVVAEKTVAVHEKSLRKGAGDDSPSLGGEGRLAAPKSDEGGGEGSTFVSPAVLDLIFLGMGEDGHVASLFPGEPESLTLSPAIYRPVTASKPPPRRITLGYSTIAAARSVWVLASGPGKEDALRRSLAPSPQTPLGRVLQSRSITRIFTDIP